MSNNKIESVDICFLIASSAKKSYQKLSENYSAIEPPTWALLLAESCRSVGFKVSLVDANAENLTNEQVLKKVKVLNAKIVCLVVYGQNVNAGTTNMRGAVDITNYLNVYFGERDYQAVLILSLNIMLFTTIFIILHYFLKYNF